ncbi:MAG: hypothetical protein QXH21_08035 [Ignisphaera sp.]
MSSPEIVDTFFPIEERIEILRKANKIFKVDPDTLVQFWRREADPTRGFLIKINNYFVLVNHDELIHVSDIVRDVIYNERRSILILDEHKMRILARGILYHKLFRKRFSSRIRGVFEFPILCQLGDIFLVGTIDLLLYTDDGTYLIELKSSSTETTLNFATLQVKMYWSILEYFTDVIVTSAYVVTPKQTLKVDRPLSRWELKRFVEAWRKNIHNVVQIPQEGI